MPLPQIPQIKTDFLKSICDSTAKTSLNLDTCTALVWRSACENTKGTKEIQRRLRQKTFLQETHK